MILDTYFYHNTITLYAGVFGSLFNNIKIKRANNKLILVPIAYSLKQKYDARNRENPDPNQLRKKTELPRFGYRMVGMRRDTTRIQHRMQTLTEINTTHQSGIKSQLQRVPFVFTFELSIKTKNIDDMNQILEQILPMFNPSLNVTVEDNKDLDMDTSVNVKMLDINPEFMFEGSFEDEQVIETTLSFDLEGYLYMPTQPVKIIKTININYHDLGIEGYPLVATDVITE